MTRPATTCHRDELIVLSLIGLGLITIIVLIIVGLFGWFESKVVVTIDGVQQTAPLPNWAENVLVAIATAAILKLGDVLAALVTLATGRNVEGMTARLADSTPPRRLALPPPEETQEQIEEAVDEVVDAAVEAGEEAKGGV